MTVSDQPYPEQTPLRHAARFAADLFLTVEDSGFLAAMKAGVQGAVAFDNFIVFAYRQGFSADLVYTNLNLARLSAQMRPYTDGLYMLDPFYTADATGQRTGLLRLADVAPEDFEQSEFYLTFYEAANVLDELHYVVPIDPGRSVHVFIEREPPRKSFSLDEADRLDALTPLISAAIRRHWSWRDRSAPATRSTPIDSAGGIEGVIRNMGDGSVTPREVEVIALLLRGHSSKLIGRSMGISEATVTNHKRNVYEKLAVHSQAQLFSLFLKTLSA